MEDALPSNTDSVLVMCGSCGIYGVAWCLVWLAMMAIVLVIIALIGYFTIGSERIIYHIGCGAIGFFTAMLAHWIIDKITDKHE